MLDPACGSGNFLYVAIHMLLDLEKEVIAYAASQGLSLVPHVSPSQLHGLEINPYAQQLAQVVIWIGYLQWMHYNGFKEPRDPVLQPIENIRCKDAILDLSDPEHPKEPEWPEAEFIVGNPPFLGGKLLRTNLGDEYVDAMFRVWDERVPREADLCCYWFEKARRQIERKKCFRAGLLATQGIRGGANRKVLQQIKRQRRHLLCGKRPRLGARWGKRACVDGWLRWRKRHRSHPGRERQCGRSMPTCGRRLTPQRHGPYRSNLGLSFMADTKGGAFDVPEEAAVEMLHVAEPARPPKFRCCRPLDQRARRYAAAARLLDHRFRRGHDR